nr:MAG TPA: minor structural protein [Caudoviricetes sp.]
MLKELGIEQDAIEAIVKAHGDTVDALKAERDAALDRASIAEEKAGEAGKQEIDKLTKELAEKSAEFADFKKSVDAEKADAEKAKLYRQLLAEQGVDARRIDSIMRVTDLSEVSVKDGQIEDAEKLAEGIRDTWADFIGTVKTKTSRVDTPPATDPSKPEPTNLAEAMHQKYD